MLCIFDWDGTLCDSVDKIVACMQAAAAEVGLPELPATTVQGIIGLGLPEAIKTLYPSGTDQQLESVRVKYSEHFVLADKVPSLLFDGVLEGLEELKSLGCTLAVATGKSRRGLDRVWDRMTMGHHFHGSRCADETRSKPHPLMLNELLQQFDVSAENAVMVGDTTFDLEMAETINMPRLGVSYGVHDNDMLNQHKPDLIVDRFEQAIEWIKDRKAGQ